MDAHLIDSAIFGHLWSTPESHAIFGESERLTRWMEVILALAEAQAECGIIPKGAAAYMVGLRGISLPIAKIAARTRETGHSTLGLILTLRELLPLGSAEYIYYGATVQDISDTAQVLEMRAVGTLLWRDLRAIEAALLDLAKAHRETPMPGRTHGQVGSPVSLGFKAASFADEIGRHLERLAEGRRRWLVGQCAGAVGTLGFYGDKALALRAAFCRRLDLGEPAISWLSSRDRIVEFAETIASAATGLARLANEVYALQRQGIGELREARSASTVGSITMPHKRNPECSEQIVTLAQAARAQAALLADCRLHEHERDGRTWKAEWAAFPALSHSVLTAVAMTRVLVSGVEIDEAAMRRNLASATASERLLSALAKRIGKHRAQDLLHKAYLSSRESGIPLYEVLSGDATPEELALLTRIDLGAAPQMVDLVLAEAHRRRAAEGETW